MVMLAQMVAVNASACRDVILDSRRPWLLEGNNEIAEHPERWLRLYREPFRLKAMLNQLLLAPQQVEHFEEAATVLAQQGLAVDQSLMHVIRDSLLASPSTEMGILAQRRCHLIYRLVHLPLMRRLLAGPAKTPTYATHWLALPEVVFFMKVAVPCWLEYQQTPYELFCRARDGDWKAIACLLRLDPEADKENELGKHVGRLRITRPKQYQRLNKARYEGRKKSFTLQQVKFLLGGLLMKWSQELETLCTGRIIVEAVRQFATESNQAATEAWIECETLRLKDVTAGCKLNAPDIKKLFDAVAQDTGQGLVDNDFDQQRNSIYKRLRSNGKLWPRLLQADKNRAA